MKATHYFHKIKIHGRASKYSAYFNGDPMARYPSLAYLVDCERIDARGAYIHARNANKIYCSMAAGTRANGGNMTHEQIDALIRVAGLVIMITLFITL